MGIKEDKLSRRDVYDLDPQRIEVEDGYNLRQDFGEDFGEFCEDVKNNGVREPITVKRTTDGKYFVRKGHRRLKAAQLANLPGIPCMLEARTISDIDAVFEQLSGNNAKPFTHAEKGEGFRRLLGFGCKIAVLMRRTGHSKEYIEGCLTLAANPDFQAAGISPSAAAQLAKQSSGKAREVVASGAKTGAQVKQILNGATAKAPKPKFLRHEFGRFSNAGRQRELTDLEKGYLRGICVALGTERPLELSAD